MSGIQDDIYLLKREITELRKEIALMRADILKIFNLIRGLKKRTSGLKRIGDIYP